MPLHAIPIHASLVSDKSKDLFFFKAKQQRTVLGSIEQSKAQFLRYLSRSLTANHQLTLRAPPIFQFTINRSCCCVSCSKK